MKGALTALLGLFAIGSSYAQEPPVPCAAKAAERKLAGAALKSFMSKCEKDAKTACDLSATEKKLYGAARISFTTKCVGDAVRDYDQLAASWGLPQAAGFGPTRLLKALMASYDARHAVAITEVAADIRRH